MANFDFKDLFAELEYTDNLAKEGIKIAQIEDLKVYTSIDNFEFRTPSLSKRFNFFMSNFFKAQNLLSRELLCSQINPNWLTCLLCYFILLNHSYIFPFWVKYSTILITFIVFIIAFCFSLINSNLMSKDYFYILTYPILSIYRLIYNFPIIRFIRNIIKQTTRKHIIHS